LTGERKRFLELASSVGEYVILRAETVEDGVRWETIGYGGEPEYSSHVYSGVSGIVIFLADLCRITGDGRVREWPRPEGAGWTGPPGHGREEVSVNTRDYSPGSPVMVWRFLSWRTKKGAAGERPPGTGDDRRGASPASSSNVAVGRA